MYAKLTTIRLIRLAGILLERCFGGEYTGVKCFAQGR